MATLTDVESRPARDWDNFVDDDVDDDDVGKKRSEMSNMLTSWVNTLGKRRLMNGPASQASAGREASLRFLYNV